MNFLPSSANNSLVQTWKNEKKKKKEKEKKKKKKREKEKKLDRRTILSPRGELDFLREARSKATTGDGGERGVVRIAIIF